MSITYGSGLSRSSTVFKGLQVKMASPAVIRSWSKGEVTSPETLSYKTLLPVPGGLFCEKIFGPTKDWCCSCGKYMGRNYQHIVCEVCGVEVTRSSVRRERMGHIELEAPVCHIWYLRSSPNRICQLLGIGYKQLEKVLYYAAYIVISGGMSGYREKDVITAQAYGQVMQDEGKRDGFEAGMGAEAIQKLLKAVDVKAISRSLHEKLACDGAFGGKGKRLGSDERVRLLRRVAVADDFIRSGNRPEWMMLTVLPVIPPDLRPMTEMDGGRFASSDLNELYRLVINRNIRLRELKACGAPDMILRNEKRMLQEAVDNLLDNGRHGRESLSAGKRHLKSLSDALRGKTGRFRQNLLGKRVDYSGRSVIAVGPSLKMYQCGLPKEMALELFRPFVERGLLNHKKAFNIKQARRMVDTMAVEVWDELEEAIKGRPVLLNRAPTLHRLGIQAFEPVLVEGHAIRLHPLVCPAFNADFDGDQMAVHLPLSEEAQAESRFIMLSTNNLLKPSDGGPVAVPSQDMVLGIYYMTQERPDDIGAGKAFCSMNEALLAYENKVITYQSPIRVRLSGRDGDGAPVQATVETTLGRCLFNEIIPQDLGYVDRSLPENLLVPEVNRLVKKEDLKDILGRVIDVHGITAAAEVIDKVKDMGYHYSTIASMTVSVADMTVPPQKAQMLEEAGKCEEEIRRNYQKGMTTSTERYHEIINLWKRTDDALSKTIMPGLGEYNNIFMMADSGARGSSKQIKQLVGMRGLMADTTGKTIELPIRSSFREGLDVLEYFISSHGARKGMSDTALRTADSGYMTRRLVDVSHPVYIRDDDCRKAGEDVPGMDVGAISDEKAHGSVIEPLAERIEGRFLAEDIYDTETGALLAAADTMVMKGHGSRLAEAVLRSGKGTVRIRTAFTCRCRRGICAKCYGADLSSGRKVSLGEAVGVIAAQSIGEPGTQLTMRTFHFGGVASGQDITQGLPRVEEIFEARRPKGVAVVSDLSGTMTLQYRSKNKKVRIALVTADDGETKGYPIPYDTRLLSGDESEGSTRSVKAGEPITEGNIDPHDLLRILGVRAVEEYMLKEVQKVYRSQGVDIADKHIEIIVRQLLRTVRIIDGGDSSFLPGRTVERCYIEDENEKLAGEGKRQAVYEVILQGITKTAMRTESFISAASFQETTKALTDAAVAGKTDPLDGMKENVIIGRLIPAGTGMPYYRDLRLDTEGECGAGKARDFPNEQDVAIPEFD